MASGSSPRSRFNMPSATARGVSSPIRYAVTKICGAAPADEARDAGAVAGANRCEAPSLSECRAPVVAGRRCRPELRSRCRRTRCHGDSNTSMMRGRQDERLLTLKHDGVDGVVNELQQAQVVVGVTNEGDRAGVSTKIRAITIATKSARLRSARGSSGSRTKPVVRTGSGTRHPTRERASP